jgi:hypothetical protein
MRTALRCHGFVAALAFALTPVFWQPLNAQQPLSPSLKNWPAPLYWAPTPREAEQQRVEQRILHPDASPITQAASTSTTPAPMTFIAVTPCRVLDTRSGQGFTGAFGPPSLAGSSNRVVPMPTSTTCSIPSSAGAYSLNFTVVPSGPLAFLSVWPAGAPYPNVSTLNDPIPGGVIANAAIVVAGTSGAIQMFTSDATDVIIDINGYYLPATDLNQNTALGNGALSANTSGVNNTAVGNAALLANTTGSSNTAIGNGALEINNFGTSNSALGTSALGSNSSGAYNTGLGAFSLADNASGNNNTSIGYAALFHNTATNNSAIGSTALQGNTTGQNNTAVGANALYHSATGDDNTAVGANALQASTAVGGETAVGSRALLSNTTGQQNTAVGVDALNNNVSGTGNTAVGNAALFLDTADGNTAVGDLALEFNTTGYENVALGAEALQSNEIGLADVAVGYHALINASGSSNVAVGAFAGSNIAGGNYNVTISNLGNSGDDGVIRIGQLGTQNSVFLAGVYGVNNNGLQMTINSSGQLGTTLSSRRYKEDIDDMSDASSGLLRLRPVTFRYKKAQEDGSKPLEYGLIAEEVEDVYPDLVVRNADGLVDGVQYQKLTPMLVNEVQKLNLALEKAQDENRKLEGRLAALEALLSAKPAVAGGGDQ